MPRCTRLVFVALVESKTSDVCYENLQSVAATNIIQIRQKKSIKNTKSTASNDVNKEMVHIICLGQLYLQNIVRIIKYDKYTLFYVKNECYK